MSFKERWLPVDQRRTMVISGVALLLALRLVLGLFTIKISTTNEIPFSYIAVIMMGAFYGPVIGGAMGAVADIVGIFLSGGGMYFPGFTLSAAVIGALYGFLLFRHPHSMKRVILSFLLASALTSFFFTPIWLYMMYGTWILGFAKVIQVLLLLPVKIVILYVVWKLFERVHLIDRYASKPLKD